MDKSKTTIHVYVDKSTMDLFEKAYPRCRSRFIENALQIATVNKTFFDSIFFKDFFPNDKGFNSL